jgi:hypothetical protein
MTRGRMVIIVLALLIWLVPGQVEELVRAFSAVAQALRPSGASHDEPGAE